MPYHTFIVFLLAVLSLTFTTCAPEFDAGDGTYKTLLKENIRNVTYGSRRVTYVMQDTARWREIISVADTTVMHPSGLNTPELKFRSGGIWYNLKRGPDGWHSNEPLIGFERRFDTTSIEANLMVTKRHIAEVTIPAADVVLNGDSVRIAVVHELKPAYDWNFIEHQPQPDRLLLTTWGNDTMPIVPDLECMGPITSSTAFRIGKHYYGLRYLTPAYDAIIIEELEDGRNLALTAELDLNYKQVPVKDADGNPTTLKRTPGKEKIIYFYGGFKGDHQALYVDSLYCSLPTAERDKLELNFVSRYGMPRGKLQELKLSTMLLDSLNSVYLQSEKTCLRLNCTSYLPYAVLVDAKGRIKSFSTRGREVEALLRARSQVR